MAVANGANTGPRGSNRYTGRYGEILTDQSVVRLSVTVQWTDMRSDASVATENSEISRTTDSPSDNDLLEQGQSKISPPQLHR